MERPLDKQTVDNICIANGLRNAKELAGASIRQLVSIVRDIEKKTGVEYIRMEIGEPGLPAEQIGIEAEHEALLAGVGSKYPIITGIEPLTKEASRFVKAFINLDIPASCCVPSVGSMQGAFASFMALSQIREDRDTILFIDPGFPVQKAQCRAQGIRYESFDVIDYRGKKLEEKLEEVLSSGRVSGMIYSNPNNPTWMCLNEEELEIIGRMATKYDVIVIEDLAYLNMDFREDRSKPFEAPYQPSVARYTGNYIILVSGSKMFSYAGQRVAVVGMSPVLAERCYENLAKRYGNDGQFRRTFIFNILYVLSSGVPHSVQYALAAMFRAASDGRLNFVEHTREYARRAAHVKEIMKKNGFHIVYDKDCEQEVGDGFFFTFGYKNMTGEQLINKLIYYGISAITLEPTGSTREGLRGCVSMISDYQYDEFDKRLRLFSQDY
jgi:aspartate/methionine/tyrosine aminotransferase